MQQLLYHFDQFGQRLGFFIFREIPENLKISETFKSSVRKNEVGQGTAELNEMVQYILPRETKSMNESDRLSRLVCERRSVLPNLISACHSVEPKGLRQVVKS